MTSSSWISLAELMAFFSAASTPSPPMKSLPLSAAALRSSSSVRDLSDSPKCLSTNASTECSGVEADSGPLLADECSDAESPDVYVPRTPSHVMYTSAHDSRRFLTYSLM